MDNRIRILIVDDLPDIRDYFAMILSKEPNFLVVGTADSGAEAVGAAISGKPDVILMDIQMETPAAGIDATAEILAQNPEIRIIMLTIHEDDDLLFQAYCAGVMDYIVKTDSIIHIVSAIQNVYENKIMLRPPIAKKIVGELARMKAQQHSFMFAMSTVSRLTNSEFEVLSQIFEGKSYKEISGTRFVSVGTVKSQVNSILKKFNQKNMKELIAILKGMNFENIIKERNVKL
ncbi:MAG: response regulator transcription factor [Oscillospiraceae bacterium]|nr:response regulator transcription factor [Oscillospiraceae bacterium]